MLKMSKLSVVAFLLALSMNQAAYAAQGYVGGLVGFALPTVNAGTSKGRVTFGGNAGYHLSPEWTLGAYFLTSSETVVLTSALSASVSLSYFGIEPAYWMVDGANQFHLGARAGLASVGAAIVVAGASVSASASEFSFGPAFGYDYALSPEFSVGADVSYMLIAASNAVHMLNAVASIKYWF